MGTRLTGQLRAIEERIKWVEQDPDWPEFVRLAEAAGKDVEMPWLLEHFYDRGIDIERARKELGDG